MREQQMHAPRDLFRHRGKVCKRGKPIKVNKDELAAYKKVGLMPLTPAEWAKEAQPSGVDPLEALLAEGLSPEVAALVREDLAGGAGDEEPTLEG